MQVESLLTRLREYLKAHRMKSDDVLFVIRQDDVDSFINCISKNQISLIESINSLDQGVFHLAGSFTWMCVYFVAEFDSINIVKYLFQQNLLLPNEDSVFIDGDIYR